MYIDDKTCIMYATDQLIKKSKRRAIVTAYPSFATKM